MCHTCDHTTPVHVIVFMKEGTGRNRAGKWNMKVVRLLKIMCWVCGLISLNSFHFFISIFVLVCMVQEFFPF